MSYSVAVSSSHDEVTLTTRLTLITDLRKFRFGVVHSSGVDYGAMWVLNVMKRGTR
jgi:hypothetical protein